MGGAFGGSLVPELKGLLFLDLLGGSLLPASPQRTPTPGVTLGDSSKRAKLRSFGASPISSANLPLGSPPPLPLKDEEGVSLKFSHSYSDFLHTHKSLDQERGDNMPLAVSVCEEPFSRPPTSQNDPQKPETRGEGGTLEGKEHQASRGQEGDSRPLSATGEGSKAATKRGPKLGGALKKAVEKASLEFPNTDDSQRYLEGYWASRLEQFKKSEKNIKERWLG
ncbi:UNVERIFIED_CONTAM: hypothetical protein Sindi_1270100 [Sesamum indicum]